MSKVVSLNFQSEAINRNVELATELVTALAANRVVSLVVRGEDTDGKEIAFAIVPTGQSGRKHRLTLGGMLNEMVLAMALLPEDEEE